MKNDDLAPLLCAVLNEHAKRNPAFVYELMRKKFTGRDLPEDLVVAEDGSVTLLGIINTLLVRDINPDRVLLITRDLEMADAFIPESMFKEIANGNKDTAR